MAISNAVKCRNIAQHIIGQACHVPARPAAFWNDRNKTSRRVKVNLNIASCDLTTQRHIVDDIQHQMKVDGIEGKAYLYDVDMMYRTGNSTYVCFKLPL